MTTRRKSTSSRSPDQRPGQRSESAGDTEFVSVRSIVSPGRRLDFSHSADLETARISLEDGYGKLVAWIDFPFEDLWRVTAAVSEVEIAMQDKRKRRHLCLTSTASEKTNPDQSPE